MATVEEAVHSLLAGDEGIANLVGRNIRPLEDTSDKPTLPLITYSLKSIKVVATASGPDPDRWTNAEFEIFAVAKTRKALAALCVEVRRVCACFVGTIDGVQFAPLELDSEDDAEAEKPEGSTFPQSYQRIFEGRLFYKVN